MNSNIQKTREFIISTLEDAGFSSSSGELMFGFVDGSNDSKLWIRCLVINHKPLMTEHLVSTLTIKELLAAIDILQGKFIKESEK